MTHDDDHDRGLQFDVGRLLDRRGALKLLAGAALLGVVGGCAADEEAATPTTSTAGGTAGTSATSTTPAGAAAGAAGAAASCDPIPDETAGPYPGDGSNGPNVLTQSGIVRSDITRSFGSSSGTAAGIPLRIELTVQDVTRGCAALAGAAVYLWHCDREGRYSLYSPGVTDQNYLRGVQEAGADGRITFTSIFPAAYAGRWPHVHFEVYRSLSAATSAGNRIATSQLALPESACREVYATSGYEASVRNLAQTSLSRDMVFADGADQQLADVSGGVGSGYTARLAVPV